jgi:eukaryotic-like serine/threonine-protein kinase
MALRVGTRLGPYEVIGPLGAGGMGEVYRARDTKLNRDVALKVLPAAVAHDPSRLARLTHEAQVLASLNHPHIGGIYGLEELDQVTALVLELIEGETLSERIARGPVPLDDARSLATQIAQALEAAHERGVVHRDLKPANIKVTADGQVKILDFGLAKVLVGDQWGFDLTQSAPGAVRGTGEGTILGTAAYMSPEQARGKPLDRRTDVWAFGCILFEMLSGRPTFARETITDTLAAVLERTPDWKVLPASTPANITRVLRRCLQKDQRHRLRDIGDARLDLEEAHEEMGASDRAVSALREVQVKRLTDFVGMKESPAMSPDGKMVAFVALVSGRRQLWIRMLAGGAPLQLTRQDRDHEHPRWAPDSSSLIYYTPSNRPDEDGTIWEISALGGWPRRLTSAIGEGDVSHDGRRIALFRAVGDQPALVTVARDGSDAETVAVLPGGHGYTSPRWSPDDRSIAFQRSTSGTGIFVSIEIVSIADCSRHAIGRGQWRTGLCWLPDGRGLVYGSSHGSTLLYPPIFNLRTTTSDGRADRQLTFGEQSFAEPDTQCSGRLLARRTSVSSDIWEIPVDGPPDANARAAIRITSQTGQVRTPSPNARDTEIVYLSDNGGHANLWIAGTDGADARQITFEHDPAVIVGIPTWSPSADLIAFVMIREARVGLWLINPDGSALRQLVGDGRAPCWSGDGRWVYYESVAGEFVRLEKIRADGGQSIVIREEPGANIPAISPDGTALYYGVTLRSNVFGSERSDKEIRCARPEHGPSETIARISAERIRGVPPVLSMSISPDGRWLAMPLTDGATTNIWAVPVAGGPMKPITDFRERSVEIDRGISWSSDSRFIYAAIAETQSDIVMFDGLIE